MEAFLFALVVAVGLTPEMLPMIVTVNLSKGALAMLLLAPQSGKRTRAKLQRQSHELREQTAETVEDAVAQARVKARQITADVHEQAEALQQRGQDMLDEQKKRLSTVVKAGKSVTRSFS